MTRSFDIGVLSVPPQQLRPSTSRRNFCFSTYRGADDILKPYGRKYSKHSRGSQFHQRPDAHERRGATKDDLQQFERRLDARFDTLESRVGNIETELRDIRQRLEALDEAAGNASGFAKEIDHLLKRLAVIEKHLGLQTHIKA